MAKEDLLVLKDGFIRDSFKISRQKERDFSYIKKMATNIKVTGLVICLTAKENKLGKIKAMFLFTKVNF
jgi:hypothetical protein